MYKEQNISLVQSILAYSCGKDFSDKANFEKLILIMVNWIVTEKNAIIKTLQQRLKSL